MGFYIKLYLATLVAFFAIDMLWLGFVARTFYRKHLGFIMADTPNWTAAALFYLLFIAGILVFAVLPGLKEQSLPSALGRAAFFGLVTYAAYDLTNLATLRNWPVIVTVVDLAWGVVLCTAVGAVSFLTAKWIS